MFVWLLFPKAGVIASPGAATTRGSRFQTYCLPNRDRDSPELSARTGRARPVREPRRNRGLDAAAGSPRPGRVCRSAAGGRPITLSQACGERRDPSSPQPGRTSRPVRGLEGTADYTLRRETAGRQAACPDGTSPTGHAARASSGERRDPPDPQPRRDEPARAEGLEEPRIRRCGGKPPTACHGVRTGQARPYTVTGQPSGPPIAAGSAHFRSAPAARGPWPEAKATGHHRPLKRPVAMPRRRWRPPFWQTRQRWRGTPRFLESSARSDEPPGQRTRRNRGLHAAAGVLALGECAVRAAGVPPWHTLPGLRGTTAIPQGSLPGRDEPARAESPGGTAD